ncbi:hypothetical protein ES703_29952 [subsurface metagenome]
MPVCPITHEECVPTECNDWTSKETIDPDCLLLHCAEVLHKVKALLDKLGDNPEAMPKPAE